MTDDRRLEYRILADILIHQLQLPGEQSKSAKGIIRELSASGCRIESDAELSMDQSLQLSFDLDAGHRIEQAHARVVRRLSQRTRKVVALEFLGLSEADQFKIREFVIWKESQRTEK